METHVKEVIATASDRKEYYRQQITEANATIADSAKAHYDELSRATIEYLDDVLDSAIERHTRFVERALAREQSVVELNELDQYLLGDIKRSVEFADGLLDRFLRLWEGLN